MTFKPVAYYLFWWLLPVVSGCTANRNAPATPDASTTAASFQVQFDTMTLYDTARHRPVPIALYTPRTNGAPNALPVVILNHGYNANRPGSNLAYTYLTEYLAARGYFVVSIQHELPTDELSPSTGNLQVVRRPHWERGVQNILFVLETLQRSRPELDYRHVTLIGHSNGGDMVMLFATEHPTLVDKVLSLDNRRMPLPRTRQPRVCSLRSSDLPADDGVLPTPEEQRQFDISIIPLSATRHSDMDDHATAAQRREIDEYVLHFLRK